MHINEYFLIPELTEKSFKTTDRTRRHCKDGLSHVSKPMQSSIYYKRLARYNVLVVPQVIIIPDEGSNQQVCPQDLLLIDVGGDLWE